MKRKLYMSVLLCAFLGVATQTFAIGESCSNPIALGTDYSAQITGAGTKWYMARMYDLPLTVRYYPNDEMAAPDLYMDFSCTPGVYDDSIICSQFCTENDPLLKLPHHVTPTWTLDENNQVCYEVSMGASYRDRLLEVGIHYDVEILIRAVYYGTGTITLTQDAFANCMDGYKFMHSGDTVHVHADDDSRHVVVPYIQWQRDSIRYVWNGTAPLQLAVGTECKFDPFDNSDPNIVNFVELQPGDTFKLTSAQLEYYVKGGVYYSEAGMFFAKWYSESEGILKVERVPMAPPRGGATLLRYNIATDVVPSDTIDKTYAIPLTWTDDVKFITPTDHVFKMYIGTDPEFLPHQAIASYQFFPGDEGHWLGLYASEMQALWKKTKEQYLYIKIWCIDEATTVTPLRWTPSDCTKEGATFYIPPKDTSIHIDTKDTRVFRLHYPQWKDGDMTFQFDQTQECKVFVSDTCQITTNTSASNLIASVLSLKNKNPKSYTAAVVNSWEPRVIDDDKFIYVRFYTTVDGGGTITITTKAPEEHDPVPFVYPAATVYVTCGEKETSGAQNVSVKVSKEQDVAIYDAASVKVEEWHQKPSDAPHSVKLQPGDYTLVGASEKIAILIKN